MVSLILPLESIIWSFLKLVSASATQVEPSHLGSFPVPVPTKASMSNPNPPFVLGTVPAILAKDGVPPAPPSYLNVPSAFILI